MGDVVLFQVLYTGAASGCLSVLLPLILKMFLKVLPLPASELPSHGIYLGCKFPQLNNLNSVKISCMEGLGENKTRNRYLRNICAERCFIILLISSISIKQFGRTYSRV